MTAVPVLRSAGRSERIFPVKSIVGATGCGGWKLQHLVRPTHPVSLRPGKSTLVSMDTTSFAGKSALQSMVLMPGFSVGGLPYRAWETQERVPECTTPCVLWHLRNNSSVGSPIYTLCWIFFLVFSRRARMKTLDQEVSRGPQSCASCTKEKTIFVSLTVTYLMSDQPETSSVSPDTSSTVQTRGAPRFSGLSGSGTSLCGDVVGHGRSSMAATTVVVRAVGRSSGAVS